LKCQQQNSGLVLEAHFLLSIVEIQRRIENNKIEKEVQTENKLIIERGTQTNKEEKRLLTNEQQQQNNKQRQKDKKLIKLLLFLLLKTKNETKDFGIF
jgi:hypothetical protein